MVGNAKKLTASNFGKIINKRSTTSASIVKSLMYKKDISHFNSIKHGKTNEKTAFSQLEKQENYGMRSIH